MLALSAQTLGDIQPLPCGYLIGFNGGPLGMNTFASFQSFGFRLSSVSLILGLALTPLMPLTVASAVVVTEGTSAPLIAPPPPMPNALNTNSKVLTKSLTQSKHYSGIQVIEGTKSIAKPPSGGVTTVAMIVPPPSPGTLKSSATHIKQAGKQGLQPAKEAIPDDFFTNLMDILDYTQTGTLIPAKTSPTEARFKLNQQYGLPLPFETSTVNNGAPPLPGSSNFTAPTYNPLVGSAVGFAWPMKTGFVSSRFGMRWGRFHQGTDIAAPFGTPIRAAAQGVVRFSGWRGGYGKLVILEHPNGYKTKYGHCSNLLVQVGQVVKKGDIVGLVGSTGHSTGPHLHYEVITPHGPQNPQHVVHQH